MYTCGLFFQLARTIDLASLFSIGFWDCSDSVVFDCFFHFICLPFRAKWLPPCFIGFAFLIFSFLCLLTFIVVWFTFFSYYFLILYDVLKSWNCLRSHIRTLKCFVRNSSTILKDINSVRLLPGIISSVEGRRKRHQYASDLSATWIYFRNCMLIFWWQQT